MIEMRKLRACCYYFFSFNFPFTAAVSRSKGLISQNTCETAGLEMQMNYHENSSLLKLSQCIVKM